MENKLILKKLHNVMTAISYIQKDKVNEFHRYSYASEEVIKKALHKEFVAQGIMFFMDILENIVHDKQIETKSGRRDTSITGIKVKYSFVDVESGEYIQGTFAGTGEDTGDKGLYKAITGAIKYILTTTFLIPTGNDPENEETSGREKLPKDAHGGVQPKSGTARQTERLNDDPTGLENDQEMQLLAKKERIAKMHFLLTRIKSPTKAQIEESIDKLTGYPLIETHYDDIIRELSRLLNEGNTTKTKREIGK